jgi:hypothetical protein
VRHDEIRTGTERFIDGGDGVTDIALRLVKRCLVGSTLAAVAAVKEWPRLSLIVICRSPSLNDAAPRPWVQGFVGAAVGGC